ncbi:helix-turn-helix domain-containing protein [Pseudomonas sp. B21-040]|uniref:helix-turn-helix domain-containing protein n=1 Tax=Pseudomonas sp. B21-040 TaxID=2895486 RepID=UPI0038D355FE
MSTQYKHLSTEERVTIMVMLFQRQSLRAIAALLGRHPSTISREIKRPPCSLTMTPSKPPGGLNSFDMCFAVSGAYLQTQSCFKWSSKCSALAGHRNKLPADYAVSSPANPSDM